MTKKEYLELVKGSQVFKGLNKELKKAVLEAKGAKMKEYAGIFTNVEKSLMSAKKDMIEKNDVVIRKFKSDMKTIKREKVKSDEKKSVKEEKKKGEELLKQIEKT